MATLTIPLDGPMQSYGSSSRFIDRDTGPEPSKSAVIGILASAMGIERSDWERLAPLAELKMAVRHDRPGVMRYDFQTIGGATGGGIRADGGFDEDPVVTERYYLSDAAFLVGLESTDRGMLEEVHEALWDPKYFLYLGRKGYLPARPLYMVDGIKDAPLMEAIMQPELMTRGVRPRRILVSYESQSSGQVRMDQPISSFAKRKFAERYIQSRWVEI